MNFGKLLITGTSIINGRGGLAYREDKRVYLPRFESPKNPFARAVAVESAPTAVRPVGPINPVKPVKPARPARPSSAASVFAPAKPAALPAQRPANWAARLNPTTLFRGAPAPAVRPVRAEQTELTLDTVRVVQNDLSDEEVEVVPIKSRPARPVEGVAAGAGPSWSELGARLFRTSTF
jgi:hypothetical protein